MTISIEDTAGNTDQTEFTLDVILATKDSITGTTELAETGLSNMWIYYLSMILLIAFLVQFQIN